MMGSDRLIVSRRCDDPLFSCVFGRSGFATFSLGARMPPLAPTDPSREEYRLLASDGWDGRHIFIMFRRAMGGNGNIAAN